MGAHIADVFERRKIMLLHSAISLPAADLKMLLDMWRMHPDPNAPRSERRRCDRSDQMPKRPDALPA